MTPLRAQAEQVVDEWRCEAVIPHRDLLIEAIEAFATRVQEECAYDYERGFADAQLGEQEVHYDFDDELNDGKPFCRIKRYADNGDSSVGIPPTSFWVLAPNQKDTSWGDRRMHMDTQGLYEKFTITRNEGTPKFGGEHFVLRPKNDPWAKAALLTYAAACEKDAPTLSQDIREWIASL